MNCLPPSSAGRHSRSSHAVQAFVTCQEVVRAGGTMGRILATNVFERQGGAWKIVHHQGSIPPTDFLPI